MSAVKILLVPKAIAFKFGSRVKGCSMQAGVAGGPSRSKDTMEAKLRTSLRSGFLVDKTKHMWIVYNVLRSHIR